MNKASNHGDVIKITRRQVCLDGTIARHGNNAYVIGKHKLLSICSAMNFDFRMMPGFESFDDDKVNRFHHPEKLRKRVFCFGSQLMHQSQALGR